MAVAPVQEVGAACFDGQSGYHLEFHVKPENPFFGLCLQVGPSVLLKHLVDASRHIDCVELTLLATAIRPVKLLAALYQSSTVLQPLLLCLS